MVSQKGLKLNQLKVAQLSATGLSTRQIETETGVSKATVARWLKMPEVQIQIQKFRQEMEIETHKVNRQTANKELVELQENMRTAAQRQLRWSGEVQKAGYTLLHKVNQWIEEIDAVVDSDTELRLQLITKLLPLIPSYARAAADMSRAGSDAEDKIFALEEIAQRLDHWDKYMQSRPNLN
jgi:transposase